MLEMAILGAIATALVQFLKNKFDGNKAGTLFILVVVSFIISFAVWALQEYNLWQWFLGIMATANLIYAFIVQHFEDAPPDTWQL